MTKYLKKLWNKTEELSFGTVGLMTWFLDDRRTILHVAVYAFEKAYEYTPEGLQLGGRKKYGYVLEQLGKTELQKEDLDNWWFDQEAEFSAEKFDIGHYNSVTIANKMCEHLKLNMPPDILEISNRMKERSFGPEDLETYKQKLKHFRSSGLFSS